MTPAPNVLRTLPSVRDVDVDQTKSKRDQTTVRALARPADHYFREPTAYVDRAVHATIARLTGGLSPAALALAYGDWAAHLAIAPGKQMDLVGRAAHQWIRMACHAIQWTTLQGRMIEPLY